jgi:hypothetical protein
MAYCRCRGAGLLVPNEAACPCASTPLLLRGIFAYYISPRHGWSGLQILGAINGFGIWPYAFRETQRSVSTYSMHLSDSRATVLAEG